MQFQHQSRLQPLRQARPGGEFPFFARAALSLAVGTIVCVSYGMSLLPLELYRAIDNLACNGHWLGAKREFFSTLIKRRWRILGGFGAIRETSGKFSGVQWASVLRLPLHTKDYHIGSKTISVR